MSTVSDLPILSPEEENIYGRVCTINADEESVVAEYDVDCLVPVGNTNRTTYFLLSLLLRMRMRMLFMLLLLSS